jgi:PEP-CTERM motif-containing protein
MRRLFSFLAVLPLAVTPVASLNVQNFPGAGSVLVTLSHPSKSDLVFRSVLTDAAQGRAAQAAQDRKGGDRAGAEPSTGANPTVGSGKDIRGTPAADPPGDREGPIGATTTPEPSTMIMLATGIAAVAAVARRFRGRNPVR